MLPGKDLPPLGANMSQRSDELPMVWKPTVWKWTLTTSTLICLLLCGSRPDQGQRPRLAAPHALIRFDQYRLGNGLRVLLAPDAATPTVALCVTYGVGSRRLSAWTSRRLTA